MPRDMPREVPRIAKVILAVVGYSLAVGASSLVWLVAVRTYTNYGSLDLIPWILRVTDPIFLWLGASAFTVSLGIRLLKSLGALIGITAAAALGCHLLGIDSLHFGDWTCSPRAGSPFAIFFGDRLNGLRGAIAILPILILARKLGTYYNGDSVRALLRRFSDWLGSGRNMPLQLLIAYVNLPLFGWNPELATTRLYPFLSTVFVFPIAMSTLGSFMSSDYKANRINSSVITFSYLLWVNIATGLIPIDRPLGLALLAILPAACWLIYHLRMKDRKAPPIIAQEG